MRRPIFLLALAMVLGCANDQPEGSKESSLDARALRAARQWVTDQGRDPASYEFDTRFEGDGWSVYLEFQPPTPGGHTMLKIDSKGNVVEVFPGA